MGIDDRVFMEFEKVLGRKNPKTKEKGKRK